MIETELPGWWWTFGYCTLSNDAPLYVPGSPRFRHQFSHASMGVDGRSGPEAIRAHDETLRSEGVDIIERGVEVKPPFHVTEHHGHAVVIGCDQLIRLVGQDREGRNRFAFDVRIIPDAGEPDGLAVLAREEIRLLFCRALRATRRSPRPGSRNAYSRAWLERAASQRVGAGVEQGWASLAGAASKVDPEPRHSGCERLAAFGEERRHLLGRRDVGIVFEVDERAREAARDFAPLFEAADTVAHGRYG